MAYYLDRKQFNKEAKEINKKLFSGFGLLNRMFSEEKNKHVEHFATLPDYNEMVYGEKNQDEILSEEISLSYRMTREERLFLIKDALAESLGFDSYFTYKRKTKFLKDRQKLKKLNTMDFSFFSNFEKDLQKRIKEKFKFTKKIDLILNLIMYKELNNKKEKFFTMNYQNEKECFDLFLFVIGNESSGLKNIYNEDGQNNENLLKIKEYTSLVNDQEIYEEINNIYVLSELTKGKDRIDIDFINNYKYTSQLINCKEIKELNQTDFDVVIKNAEGTLYKENVKILKALYEKNDDIYLNTMNDLNEKIMKREV